ncbi:MAG: HAMP domain-containing sensor histidine kinase [Acetobacteraceae bacterium]
MLTWTAGLDGAFQALWLPVVVLSGVATGAFLAGGFAGRRRTAEAHSVTTTRTPPPPAPGPRPFAADHLDLEAELHDVLGAHDARAIERHVRLEIAVQPGLTVRADPVALRGIVSDLLANAIGHTAEGRVLLGAGRHGGRVRISVVDDGAPVERAEQEAHLRDAERLVALQGGTLEITVRPGSGTIAAIRLPEPAPNAMPARVATQTAAQAAEPVPARDAAVVRTE